jgi:hypothetical protein
MFKNSILLRALVLSVLGPGIARSVFRREEGSGARQLRDARLVHELQVRYALRGDPVCGSQAGSDLGLKFLWGYVLRNILTCAWILTRCHKIVFLSLLTLLELLAETLLEKGHKRDVIDADQRSKRRISH